MSENLPNTTRTTLLAAAKHMREHGWCQREISTADGRVCLMGAVMASVNARRVQGQEWHDLFMAARDRLYDTIGSEHGVGHWNDWVCLSQREAIAMLERAAGCV